MSKLLPHERFNKLIDEARKKAKNKCFFCKSEEKLEPVQVEKDKSLLFCEKCRTKPFYEFDDTFLVKDEKKEKERKEAIKEYYRRERWGYSKESLFLDSDSD
jgi:hypothetical protein